MRGRLRRNEKLLKLISEAKPKVRKELIKLLDRDLICTICEISDNTLRGNINLTDKQKQVLSRHKATLRKLAKKKRRIEKKEACFGTGW